MIAKKIKICLSAAILVFAVSGCAMDGFFESGSNTLSEQSEVNTVKEKGTSEKAEEEVVNEEKIVTLSTSKGDIVIELFLDRMPVTAGNFLKLAKSGFYDGTTFHRVIPGFMAQGGDPLTKDDNPANDGTGDPGYFIEDEFHDELSNVRGTVAMANAGPNTGGSQFFINVADNTFLDSKHPVFGRVTEGMDVVDSIVKAPRDERDRPFEDIAVLSVSVE